MLYIGSILEDLGYHDMKLTLEVDSSSGIAIGNRQGLGRVRHLDVRCLWIQQLIMMKVISLKKIDGTKNTADVGTNMLPKKTLDRHLQTLGVRRYQNGELTDLVTEDEVDTNDEYTAANTITTEVIGNVMAATAGLKMKPALAATIMYAMMNGAKAETDVESAVTTGWLETTVTLSLLATVVANRRGWCHGNDPWLLDREGFGPWTTLRY